MVLHRRRMAAAFAGLFVLCGVLHILTYRRNFAECFVQWYCAVLLVLWSLSVHIRVTDRRLRRLLWAVAGFLVLFLLCQVVLYDLCFDDLTVRRWCWYGYYISFLSTAALLLLAAEAVWRAPSRPLPRWTRIPVAGSALLILGVLTNDLHQLAFRFHSVPFLEADKSYGPLFYAYFAAFAALILLGFRTMLGKARALPIGPRRWIPMLPVALLSVWLLLNSLGLLHRAKGVLIWNIGECFCFGLVGYLEACIQIGLIPANTGYDRLFSAPFTSAVIVDGAGKPVYRSAGAPYPFEASESLSVREQPIRGGKVVWAADLSPLLRVNRELEENNRRLQERNAYLRQDGQMKRELAELTTRNELYERVSRVVRPQLEELTELAGLPGEDFARSLPRICVLTCFIKRRSNMELVARDGLIHSDELMAALAESTEYLRLCGVDCALSGRGNGEFPSAVVTTAYSQFQRIVTENLEALRACMVFLRAEQGLELRLGLRADRFDWDSAAEAGAGEASPRIQVAGDGRDITIVLRFDREVRDRV